MADIAKANAQDEDGPKQQGEDVDSNSRTRGNHSKEAIKVLKGWLFSAEHVYHPYPTDKEKEELMAKTGLSKKQLSNWFTNARKRVLQPKYENFQHKRRKCFGMYANGFMPMMMGEGMKMGTHGMPVPTQATMSMMSASASFNDLAKFTETPNAPSSGDTPDPRTLAIADILSRCPIAGPPRVVFDKGGKPQGIFLPVDGSADDAKKSTTDAASSLAAVFPAMGLAPSVTASIAAGSTISPSPSFGDMMRDRSEDKKKVPPAMAQENLPAARASRRCIQPAANGNANMLQSKEVKVDAVHAEYAKDADTVDGELYQVLSEAELGGVFGSTTKEGMDLGLSTVPEENDWDHDPGLSSYSPLMW